jgi:phenylacetic acid degradation protein
MNAVIMDEAEIGAEAIVAACAFVPAGMVVPARTLVAGLPAKVKRALTDAEIAWKLEGTLTYQELTRRCLASMTEVTPLTEPEADRPSVQRSDVQPLIATRRDEGLRPPIASCKIVVAFNRPTHHIKEHDLNAAWTISHL